MWVIIFLAVISLITFAVTIWVLVDCYQKAGQPCGPQLQANGSSNSQQQQQHAEGAPLEMANPATLRFNPDFDGCAIEAADAKQFKLTNHQTGIIRMHLESDGANFATSVVVGQTEVRFIALPPGDYQCDCEFEVTQGSLVVVTVRNSSRTNLTLQNCAVQEEPGI